MQVAVAPNKQTESSCWFKRTNARKNWYCTNKQTDAVRLVCLFVDHPAWADKPGPRIQEKVMVIWQLRQHGLVSGSYGSEAGTRSQSFEAAHRAKA